MSEKKDYSLSELSIIVKKLADAVQTHTENRNRLWAFMSGDESPPALVIKDMVNKGGQDITIFTGELHQETLELLYSSLIEHEEKIVVNYWDQLFMAVSQAVETIKALRAQREQQEEHKEEHAFPVVLPIRPPQE